MNVLSHLRRSIGLLGLSASAMLAIGPAQADMLRAHYTVSIIGLPMGVAGITGVFKQNTYRIDVSARLTGLASAMASFKGAATAAGTVATTRLLPASYALATSSGGMTRTVRMAMTGGTVKGVEISPPIIPHPDRVPLTAADQRNIVDPLSALIMPVSAATSEVGPAACNRTLPVFDGYARFNIELTFVEKREVQTKGYSGPVAVCSARYVPVSGHRNDNKGTQFMADNHDLETWLAPVGNTHVFVPYRIAVRTMVGMTIIEASEFETDSDGNGKKQALVR